MEGRAFLCKPVLGADEPRPPVSPCSPRKTTMNAIPQYAVPWNLCRNQASHERMHRERRRQRNYGCPIQCALSRQSMEGSSS